MWDLTIHLLRAPTSSTLMDFPALGRSFHTIIRNVIPPLQLMWDLTIHLLRAPTSSISLVPLSNRCGISQFSPLQSPTSLLTLVPLFNQYGISQFFSLRSSASTVYSPLQSMWDLTINPLLGLSVLAGTPADVCLYTIVTAQAQAQAHR